MTRSLRRVWSPWGRLALVVVVLGVLAGAVLGIRAATSQPSPPAGQPAGEVPGEPSCPGPGPCELTGPAHTSVELVPWSWSEELSFYNPPAPLPDDPAGTLLRIQHLAPGVTVPPGSVAWRILYLSTTLTGTTAAVSGVVVAPGTPAPRGGFPLVSWAHATTGLPARCAPSRFASLEIPSLDALVSAGDAVVATDYPGLGAPGTPSYLVGVPEGLAVLDAAVAATEVPGLAISRQVVALGYSQGGQAALFAGQLAASARVPVHLLGVVAVAPAVELAKLVALSATSKVLNGLYVTLAEAWAHVYLDLPATDLLSAQGQKAGVLATAQCTNALSEDLAHVAPQDLRPPDVTEVPAFARHLGENSPGAVPLAAPTLVVAGTTDEIVPVAATEAYVARACLIARQPFTFSPYPGHGHGTIVAASTSQVLSYIAARFAGKAARGTCPVPAG